MDGAKAISKIYRGYGKVALKIGFEYDLYRPSVTPDPAPDPADNNPLLAGRQIGSIMVSLNQQGDYKKPDKYGDALWWSYHDGRETQVFDYLVGRMGTFFIISQQDLLPIQVVACNRVVTVTRTASATSVGAVGYQGYTTADADVLMNSWPASILQGREQTQNLLPMDTTQPKWQILLPYLDGVLLRTSDIITDDLGRRYGIGSAELTDLGWRLTANQLQA